MKINARLNEDLASKLNYLMAQHQAGVSEVLREAILLYYEQTQEEVNSAKKAIQSSGLIGCSELEATASSDYKAQLSELWGNKYDHR